MISKHQTILLRRDSKFFEELPLLVLSSMKSLASLLPILGSPKSLVAYLLIQVIQVELWRVKILELEQALRLKLWLQQGPQQ
jgi:hypothetical protein